MRLSEREAKQHFETAQQQYAYISGREAKPTKLEIEVVAKAIYDLDPSEGQENWWNEAAPSIKDWYRNAAVSVFDAVHQIITRED